MRGRFSLPLAALTLLFLLQGLSALFASLFTLSYDALIDGRRAAMVQAMVPLIALLAPALPLARYVGRERLVAAAAAVTALARIALCLPSARARWLASALVVAAAAIFLSAAAGVIARRSITHGAIAALGLEQLLRLAGDGWDVLMRPGGSMLLQLVLSAAATALAAAWLLESGRRPRVRDAAQLERRSGGLRLRGALAFGVLLFLEMSVLSRAEVGARWSGIGVVPVAALLIAITALALFVEQRVWRHRRERTVRLVCAALAVFACVVAPLAGGIGALLLLVAGHGAALLLITPALAPAGGRRKGWTLSAGLLLCLLLAVAHSFTFFSAFTVPSFEGRAPAVFVTAGVVLALMLTLIPRVRLSASRFARSSLVAALVLPIGIPLAIAVATPPARSAQSVHPDALTVATYNVHLGFDGAWRHDPEAIAATIRASGADVVMLQEVPAGLLVAYSVDLAHWLGRRLGMDVYYAPSKNGLLGDAALTRVPVTNFASERLPDAGLDAKRAAVLDVDVAGRRVRTVGVHFGVTEAERRVQTPAVLGLLDGPAILAGDLNAEPGSPTDFALDSAGLSDAFAMAGVIPGHTWPAARPTQRIDWIRVRGYDVSAAHVSDGAGSDHRLVAATILLRSGPQNPTR